MFYVCNVLVSSTVSFSFPTGHKCSISSGVSVGGVQGPVSCGSSGLVCRFGEGAQLFGVDVLELLQLPLPSAVQILDVHHVRLLDASVLSELVPDSRYEARFVLAGPQELPIQSQDLLLQLTVPCHVSEGDLRRLGHKPEPQTFSCSSSDVL